MNIKRLKLAIEQVQKVCNEMNKCTNKFILQDSINEMNQALTTPVVSESFCECEKPQHNYPEMVWCDNCTKKIEDN